eukprot:Skav214235  [mRNA]  locus=scaffold1133:106244:106594:+ [translate_table: standard]
MAVFIDNVNDGSVVASELGTGKKATTVTARQPNPCWSLHSAFGAAKTATVCWVQVKKKQYTLGMTADKTELDLAETLTRMCVNSDVVKRQEVEDTQVHVKRGYSTPNQNEHVQCRC